MSNHLKNAPPRAASGHRGGIRRRADGNRRHEEEMARFPPPAMYGCAAREVNAPQKWKRSQLRR